MAVEQRIKGKNIEIQVAVIFDTGEVFLSQAVSWQYAVNLSCSSYMDPQLYKSIQGRFKELFFSSQCNS